MDDGTRLLVNYLPLDAPAPADSDAIFSSQEYRLAIVDLDSADVTPVNTPPGPGGSSFNLELDGDRYVQVYADAFSDSVLYQIESDGNTIEIVGAGPNGDFQALARVR